MKGVKNGSVFVGGGCSRVCVTYKKKHTQEQICAVWGRDTVFQVLRVFRGACFFF